MNHSELCEVAKKWLVKSNSQGGHGCNTALSECRSGWSGEIPDAIGFRAVSHNVETVVVEVKISRSDFFADAKKPHRADGLGMGIYRYYMCPEGLIQPDEIPEKWGLLWVTTKGRIIPKAGPVFLSNNCGTFEKEAEPFRHKNDVNKEMWLLVRVMAKVNDPDKMKKIINQEIKEKNNYKKQNELQKEEIKSLKNRLNNEIKKNFK